MPKSLPAGSSICATGRARRPARSRQAASSALPRAILVVLLLAFAGACTTDNDGADGTPSPAPIPSEESIGGTPTARAGAGAREPTSATETPANAAGDTATAEPGSAVPDDPDGLKEWLGEQQRGRADLRDVERSLTTAGWLGPREGDTEFGFGEGMLIPRPEAVDLNGDGRDEWVVSVFVAPEGPFRMAIVGVLLVVSEGSIAYESFELSLPWVTTISDLTGDGLPDLVTRGWRFGANRPDHHFDVVSAQRGPIESLFAAPGAVTEARQDADREVPSGVRASGWQSAWPSGSIGAGGWTWVVDVVAEGRGGPPVLVVEGGDVSYGDGEYQLQYRWDGELMALVHCVWLETSSQVSPINMLSCPPDKRSVPPTQ